MPRAAARSMSCPAPATSSRSARTASAPSPPTVAATRPAPRARRESGTRRSGRVVADLRGPRGLRHRRGLQPGQPAPRHLRRRRDARGSGSARRRPQPPRPARTYRPGDRVPPSDPTAACSRRRATTARHAFGTCAAGRSLHVLRGTGSAVTGVAFDPRGAFVATAGADGSARLWDARAGDSVLLLRGHAGPVHGAAFEPATARIVTASEDGTARIWDARTGGVVRILHGHERYRRGTRASAPTASASSPLPRTGRRVCGTPAADDRSTSSAPAGARSSAPRSARDGSRVSPPGATGRRTSGTPQRQRGAAPCARPAIRRVQRRVQPRRRPHRHRPAGRDGARPRRPQRPARSTSCAARASSTTPPSAPTANSSSPPATTGRRASGTPAAAACCASSAATRAPSPAPRSARTASSSSPRAPATAPPASGTPGRASRLTSLSAGGERAAFSPDGRLVVTAGPGAGARVYRCDVCGSPRGAGRAGAGAAGPRLGLEPAARAVRRLRRRASTAPAASPALRDRRLVMHELVRRRREPSLEAVRGNRGKPRPPGRGAGGGARADGRDRPRGRRRADAVRAGRAGDGGERDEDEGPRDRRSRSPGHPEDQSPRRRSADDRPDRRGADHAQAEAIRLHGLVEHAAARRPDEVGRLPDRQRKQGRSRLRHPVAHAPDSVRQRAAVAVHRLDEGSRLQHLGATEAGRRQGHPRRS